MAELAESRAALATSILAATCYALSAAGALGWAPMWLGTWTDALTRSLPLAGHVLSLAGLMMFARYVVLDVQGLIDHKPRPAATTSRLRAVATPAVTAAVASASSPAARALHRQNHDAPIVARRSRRRGRRGPLRSSAQQSRAQTPPQATAPRPRRLGNGRAARDNPSPRCPDSERAGSSRPRRPPRLAPRPRRQPCSDITHPTSNIKHSPMTVRTRFAPSPTGYLHIGGVRTALFNWLFARQHGGQFLLRIDDTDQQRNVEAALAPILHGFRWLGLDWDEGPEVGGPFGPYYQSQRGALYQEAVEALLATGHAYRDFATPEELEAERRRCSEGRPPVHLQSPLDGRDAGRRRQIRSRRPPRRGAAQDAPRGRTGARRPDPRRSPLRLGQRAGPRHPAPTARACITSPGSSTTSDADLARHPRRGAPLQHAAAGVHRPVARLPAAAYAHLPYVAEPGSKNKLSKRKLDKYLKNRDFAALMEHGLSIAAAHGAGDVGRDVQPGDRRLLRAGGLSARRDPQLPAAAGLVARRQERGVLSRRR